MQDDYSGQKIQYGDKILLRHVFTDLFLVIEPNHITDQEGMVRVNLGELSNKAIMNEIYSAMNSTSSVELFWAINCAPLVSVSIYKVYHDLPKYFEVQFISQHPVLSNKSRMKAILLAESKHV